MSVPNLHTLGARSVHDARQTEAAFAAYRQRWRDDPSTGTVGAFPLHLDIESTSVCNLRCPFCATTSQTWGPKAPGYMSMARFRRIVDEGAAHGLSACKLSFRGEPMLHPYLPEMVAYAKAQGILDVYFNTNAVLLTAVRSHALLASGLDRISISFEGLTPEAYEGYRVGARYATVLANVRRFRALRDALGSRCQIRVQTVGLPELRDQLPAYVAFWQDIADEVGMVDARREGPGYDHRGRASDWACPFLWQRMTILWDGTLLPCLMHGVSDFSLLAHGNVADVSIAEAWQGAREQHYRELHRAGQSHDLEACDQCSFRAAELDKLGVPASVPGDPSVRPLRVHRPVHV